MDPFSQAQMVATLRQRLEELETGLRPLSPCAVSSGCPELDRRLPGSGFRRGRLVEWLREDDGCGAALLALIAAREACRERTPLIVVDAPGEFYPPAAAFAGVDLNRMILVRPRNARDEVWALDQALRCPAVGAVLCWPKRLSQRTLRRLQLAAETGGVLGFFVRDASARDEPCWSEARLSVRPAPEPGGMQASASSWRRLAVELVRLRGGQTGAAVELEVNHETGSVRGAAVAVGMDRRLLKA